MPTVARGPGIRPGSHCDVPIVGWDFWPTFRELAGAAGPPPQGVVGGGQVPLFEKGNGGAVKRGEEALIFHFPWFDGVPESAIRLGDYKLMKNLNTGETRLRERMASASDAERQELQTELARHERMVEVHAAGLERLKQGRQADW